MSAEDGFRIVGRESNLIRCLQVNGSILIQVSNGVEIDSSCLLGPGVKIISGNHDLDDFSKSSTVREGLNKSHEPVRIWFVERDPSRKCPMSQLSFSDAEFAGKRKVTRREKFRQSARKARTT